MSDRNLLASTDDIGSTMCAKASGQTPDSPSGDLDISQPQSPFFSKLNYDVRRIIYDYLYEWLPPLARTRHAYGFKQDDCRRLARKRHPYGFQEDDCRGLILSCKRANKELSDAAALHLNIYMDYIRSEFEFFHGKPIMLCGEIPLHQGWDALRVITLSVNAANASDFSYSNLPGEGPLRWLLLRPFDKITLVLSCSDSEYLGKSMDTTVRYVYGLHLTVARQIGHEWVQFLYDFDKSRCDAYEQLEADEAWVESHLKIEEGKRCNWCGSDEEHRFVCAQWARVGRKAFGTRAPITWFENFESARFDKRIQTKEIVFACDVRRSRPPAQDKLTGHIHRYGRTRLEALAREDRLRVPQTDEEYDEAWPSSYHLSSRGSSSDDTQSFQAVWGIRHPKRWMLTSHEAKGMLNAYEAKGVLTAYEVTAGFLSDNGMRDGLSTGGCENIESDGIGMPLVPRTTWMEGDPRLEEIISAELHEWRHPMYGCKAGVRVPYSCGAE